MLYCVVARTAPSRVARTFQGLHATDQIRVICERRRTDRRRANRRHAVAAVPDDERRRIHGFDGRRVADRRSVVVEVRGPDLPLLMRRHADCVQYLERVGPRERDLADVEIARLVLRVQGGERTCFEDIYRALFSDVYGYFHVILSDHGEAEDATQQVFVAALQALPDFQLRRGTPFRAWLFRIARHEALNQLNRRRRHVFVEPDMLARRRELLGVPADARAIEWISDPELLAFIERLSLSQRQVLALRYMLGMRTSEVAAVLDKTDQAVRHLESRALRFLEQRLIAVGRGPARETRAAMIMVDKIFPVLRARRMALETARPSQWVRRNAWG